MMNCLVKVATLNTGTWLSLESTLTLPSAANVVRIMVYVRMFKRYRDFLGPEYSHDIRSVTTFYNVRSLLMLIS
jgi:hypothetical protein